MTPVQAINRDITKLKEIFQQGSVLEGDCVSTSIPKSRSPEAVLEVTDFCRPSHLSHGRAEGSDLVLPGAVQKMWQAKLGGYGGGRGGNMLLFFLLAVPDAASAGVGFSGWTVPLTGSIPLLHAASGPTMLQLQAQLTAGCRSTVLHMAQHTGILNSQSSHKRQWQKPRACSLMLSAAPSCSFR